MISGLGIRYPGPEAAAGRLTGARLPHVELRVAAGEGASPVDRTVTGTAALLRGGTGLLLDFGGGSAQAQAQGPLPASASAPVSASASASAPVSRIAEPWRGRVRLVHAAPPADGSLAGCAAVLVRPDGYVAWAADRTAGPAAGPAEGPADGPAPEPLTAALTRWFGPPERPARPAAATAPVTTASPRTATTAPATALDSSAPASSAPAPPPVPPVTARIRRSTMGKLDGKTALVTGASRGMGRATALRLAGEGALVAVHYGSSAGEAEDVVALIEKDGGRAFTVQAELGVPGDVHQLFLGLEQGLKERTGSTTLDILVNNAGVMGGVKPEETTGETFDRLIAVNAKAPFFLLQRALTNMPDGGRIINISTGLTRFANPDEIAYAMSKGAVEQLALHYAKYLGPRNITVNSVAPGITRNGNPVFGIPEAVEQMAALSTFNRVGEPDDVAAVVAFLASDDARWITGTFVDATGGTLLG
jgi:bifunctional oxygenase/reductase